MADVIRNVVVRVKLEQVKADLQAPDMGPVKREIESANRGVEKLNETVKRGSDTLKESVDRDAESFQSFRDETNRTAEGLSKLASAAGLYAVAMDESLPPSIRLFSAIRGGVEQMGGLTALFSQMGGLLAGPWGLAIAAAVTVATQLAIAMKSLAGETKSSEEQLRAQNAALDEFLRKRDAVRGRAQDSRSAFQSRISLAEAQGDTESADRLRQALETRTRRAIEAEIQQQQRIRSDFLGGSGTALGEARAQEQSLSREVELRQQLADDSLKRFEREQQELERQRVELAKQREEAERLRKARDTALERRDAPGATLEQSAAAGERARELSARIAQVDGGKLDQLAREIESSAQATNERQERVFELILTQLRNSQDRYRQQERRVEQLEAEADDARNGAL